jgi:hypothetical protein
MPEVDQYSQRGGDSAVRSAIVGAQVFRGPQGHSIVAEEEACVRDLSLGQEQVRSRTRDEPAEWPFPAPPTIHPAAHC